MRVGRVVLLSLVSVVLSQAGHKYVPGVYKVNSSSTQEGGICWVDVIYYPQGEQGMPRAAYSLRSAPETDRSLFTSCIIPDPDQFVRGWVDHGLRSGITLEFLITDKNGQEVMKHQKYSVTGYAPIRTTRRSHAQ